jgi:hypothetical protein
MWINFKRKTGRPHHSVALWMSIILITATVAFIATLLFTGNIPFISGQATKTKTVATNGADQWNGNERVTAPVTNFSPPRPHALTVSPLFTRAYQIYGTTNNSLGTPITTTFPTAHGWLQFFANGALLLPATQQAQDQDPNSQNQDADDSLTNLANHGIRDPATGTVRLPLLQTLLTVGSKLPVGGAGSTLTYVNLRNATAPSLMIPEKADYRGTHRSSPSITTTSAGTFIQGGTRNGKTVGHLIPAAFWNYINQPDISPHTWQKDFGTPLTEVLAFTMPVHGQTHHMLIQVFSYMALIFDQDIDTVQAPTASAGQSALQLLPMGLDYLSTVGLPNVIVQAQETVWSLDNMALLDAPGTGHAVAHSGQNFPMILLGETRWISGIPWYNAQWTVANTHKSGWISATALSFSSPGNVPGFASFDMLSPNLSSYLNSLGSNVGAVVYDITHQRMYTYNSTSPFITASAIKVPIMVTFLDALEQQEREPTDDEMNLLTSMIENSNNDSASALFVAVGKSAGISSYMQKIGVSGLSPDDDSWGYSTITPQAMVNLLTLLHKGKILNSNHRALAFNLMENVESDQRIGVGDTAPHNATVALKDGWVTDEDNLWAMNSSGIVTLGNETYIISVYTQEQPTLKIGQDIARKICGTVASLLTS